MRTNVLTIDVEDYFMVSAFADVIRPEDWHTYEGRVEQNTKRLLALLSEFGVRCTFFVLGWVAERYPALIREMHEKGHEIASHGYNHRLVYSMGPALFREDARKAKATLENLTGVPVNGYRAASYSIIKSTLWALEILAEEGYTYDSSIFPVHHDRYGFPEARRFPWLIETKSGARILEVPPSTVRAFGKNIPVAGGGYLRLFPLRLIKYAISSINRREGHPAIIYMHPWEIDPEQPRMRGKRLSVFRHYVNLGKTLHKLRSLLQKFRFAPIREVLKPGRAYPFVRAA